MRCKICGDQANGTNFGVISCIPCRAFFQRHGKNNICSRTMFKCRFSDGSCQIDEKSRKYCMYCRLAACLRAGMHRNPNASNKHVHDRRRLKDKRRLLVEQKYKCAQLIPLDLLQSDRSSLNNSEWNLMSNITHIYDTLFQEHEQKISHFQIHDEQKPIKIRLKLSSYQQLAAIYFTFIVPFLEHIPDYQSLELSNRTTLIHNNIFTLTSFYYHHMMSVTGFIPYFHKYYAPAVNMMYGNEILLENEKIRQRLDDIFHVDLFLIKLILIIFAFSNVTPCLSFSSEILTKSMNDEIIFSKLLLQIQNNYVNILWRYMLFRFQDEKSVIHLYSKIIYNCLEIQKFSYRVSELNNMHKDMYDQLIEQIETKLNFQDEN